MAGHLDGQLPRLAVRVVLLRRDGDLNGNQSVRIRYCHMLLRSGGRWGGWLSTEGSVAHGVHLVVQDCGIIDLL